MKTFLLVLLSLFVISPVAMATQTPNTTTRNANTAKRQPVFRATTEQVKQAQSIIKQRGFYSGAANGKLDAETRAGLKKFQETEGLKVTGTLNKATLEKMTIALTDRQKTM